MTDNKYEDMEGGRLGKGVVKESCAINKSVDGCPATLIKLAQSEFERACVQEFVEVENKYNEIFAKIKTELKYLKWLIVTVLATVIISKIIGG